MEPSLSLNTKDAFVSINIPEVSKTMLKDTLSLPT